MKTFYLILLAMATNLSSQRTRGFGTLKYDEISIKNNYLIGRISSNFTSLSLKDLSISKKREFLISSGKSSFKNRKIKIEIYLSAMYLHRNSCKATFDSIFGKVTYLAEKGTILEKIEEMNKKISESRNMNIFDQSDNESGDTTTIKLRVLTDVQIRQILDSGCDEIVEIPTQKGISI